MTTQQTGIQCAKVAAPVERLLDPAGSDWNAAAELSVPMQQTPPGAQPSVYARQAWATRPYGRVPAVRVRSLHNGMNIFFRLEWDNATPSDELADTNVFVDACGILLPLRGDALISSMGAPEQPVEAWRWRADQPDTAIKVTATGLGTARRQGADSLQARSSWAAGKRTVVISRAFVPESSVESTPLKPGTTTKVGIAVWEGANQERAGIKAFSGTWIDVAIQ